MYDAVSIWENLPWKRADAAPAFSPFCPPKSWLFILSPLHWKAPTLKYIIGTLYPMRQMKMKWTSLEKFNPLDRIFLILNPNHPFRSLHSSEIFFPQQWTPAQCLSMNYLFYVSLFFIGTRWFIYISIFKKISHRKFLSIYFLYIDMYSI